MTTTLSPVGGGGNDSTQIQNAINTENTAGGGDVIFGPGTYSCQSAITLKESVNLIGAGRATGSKPGTTLKRDFTGDLFSIQGATSIRHMTIDGNQANKGAGKGATFSGGAQYFENVEMTRFQDPCLQFGIDDGSGFVAVGCTFYTTATVGSGAAVKVNGADTEAIPRQFYACTGGGCTLFDFGGAKDFFVSGGYTKGLIFGRTDSSMVMANNLRIGDSEGSTTIKGDNHQFTTCVWAEPVVIDSGSSGVNLNGCEVTAWDITDNGSGNRFYAYKAYTPAWTADTTNPSIGNGSLAATVRRYDQTVTIVINLTAGSTTSFGSGQWYFSVPYSIYTSYVYTGTALVLDNSATVRYTGVASTFTTSSTVFGVYFNGTGTPLSSGQPMTWANGDKLQIQLTYTAA